MIFNESLRPDVVIGNGIELDSPGSGYFFGISGGESDRVCVGMDREFRTGYLPDIAFSIFKISEVIGLGISKIIGGEVNFIISNSQEIVI